MDTLNHNGARAYAALVHLHQEISNGAAARPTLTMNDPLDHCPGASALLDLSSGYCLNW